MTQFRFKGSRRHRTEITALNHRTSWSVRTNSAIGCAYFAGMRKRRDGQFALDDHLTVTIDRTAEVLDVGRSTVYELLHAGKLKSVKFGRAHRVVVQSIHDLIANSDKET
jgi:excisionase family DNA binding protein